MYALITPDNKVSRYEPATAIDPSVDVKPGWRWLPVVDIPSSEPTALQRLEITPVVETSRVVMARVAVDADRKDQNRAVSSERDRRVSVFKFGGKEFDYGEVSRVDIAGAGTLALAAIINGAQPANLKWAEPNADFRWIARDNASVPMDAQTTFAFAQAAARWRSDHIFAARAIKDAASIPADYAADARWPS